VSETIAPESGSSVEAIENHYGTGNLFITVMKQMLMMLIMYSTSGVVGVELGNIWLIITTSSQ